MENKKFEHWERVAYINDNFVPDTAQYVSFDEKTGIYTLRKYINNNDFYGTTGEERIIYSKYVTSEDNYHYLWDVAAQLREDYRIKCKKENEDRKKPKCRNCIHSKHNDDKNVLECFVFINKILETKEDRIACMYFKNCNEE